MNAIYSQESRQTVEIFVLIGIFIIYLLRKTSLGFLWRGFLLIVVGALIVLFAGYAKKGIKDWWTKD